MLACSKETPLEARQVHNRSLFRQCTRNMVSTLCSSAQTWCSTCFARIVSMQALLQTQITRSRALNGKACLAAMNEQRQARSDEAVSSPLLQLPDLVVAKLVKHLKHRKGSPLLAVCSSLRDAVVSGLQRIRFAFAQHETQETAAANARLLSRVCSSSRPGLKVYLDTTWRHQDGEELLSILLQPGISLGGWSNVTHLEILTCGYSIISLDLLSLAFPALKQLKLNGPMLIDWEWLSVWTQLTSLELHNCLDKGDEGDEGIWQHPSVNCPGPAILAELPSLTKVSLHTNRLHILADHLTRLTSLHLKTGYYDSRHSARPFEESMQRVVNNPNLQEVGLSCEALDDTAGPHLQLLFNSCRHLRKLDLGLTVVNQPALDAILAYGTGITSLIAGELRAVEDRTSASCGWQELWLSETDAPSHLAYLGNLPLHSVKRFKIGNSSINTLQLPYDSVELDTIPSILHRAALNLANCPAWKESNASSIRVVAEPWTMLTSLRLGGSHLNPGFWAAVEEHLPSLKELHLKQSVTFPPTDLLAFSKRFTSRPITVYWEMEEPEDLFSFEAAMASGSGGGGGSSSSGTALSEAALQQAEAGARTLTVRLPEISGLGAGQGKEATAPANQGLSRHVFVPVEAPTPPHVLPDEQGWEAWESAFTSDCDQD